ERPALRWGQLFAISLGSIVGTGWVVAISDASKAGTSALVSWAIGFLIVLILALIHAELGAMYMVSGGSGWFPIPAFGSLVGFTSGWLFLLNAAATAPVEVEAALTAASTRFTWLVTTPGTGGQAQTILTTPGYLVAAVALFVLFTLNVAFGITFLARLNWW